jgi:hypothetical protein
MALVPAFWPWQTAAKPGKRGRNIVQVLALRP